MARGEQLRDATPRAAEDDSFGMNTNLHTAGRRLDDEPMRVAAWRRTRLLATGFAPALADEVASDGGIDLHSLIDLVERGCPPELAARILAPLDWDGRPCRAPGHDLE